MKRIYSENEIACILQEYEYGASVVGICDKYNISDATFYTWKKKYSGMQSSAIGRAMRLESKVLDLEKSLRKLQTDNTALRKYVSVK